MDGIALPSPATIGDTRTQLSGAQSLRIIIVAVISFDWTTGGRRVDESAPPSVTYLSSLHRYRSLFEVAIS